MQLFFSLLILGFGLFLRTTKNPGFAPYKKFWWTFAVLGLLTLTALLMLKFLNKEL